MIVLGMLGAMSADPSQVDRPSVLPPLHPPRGERSAAPGAACAIKGVVPGRRLPGKWLRARLDPTKLRILRPGDQATMDFIPTRRNIHIDRDGNVTHITCG